MRFSRLRHPGKLLALSSLAILLVACNQPSNSETNTPNKPEASPEHVIGGPCKYEAVSGELEVVAVADGQVKFNFTPGNIPFSTSIEQDSDSQYQVGDKVKADIERITQGSCTPFVIKKIYQ